MNRTGVYTYLEVSGVSESQLMGFSGLGRQSGFYVSSKKS